MTEREVKWDGKEMGELLLEAIGLLINIIDDERSKQSFIDGWLYTGDIVTVDEEGIIKIIDRTKDLIKSGGEWISSVDLENAFMAHDAVLEACVGLFHTKWQERPVACVVLKEGYDGAKLKEELLDFLRPQFPKFWLPEDVIFMKEIPKTSVGKFLKRALREQVKDLVKQ